MAEETKNPDHDKMKTATPPEKTSSPTAEALSASDMPTVPSSPEQQGDITPEATFEELDIDSLDLVELAQIVEDEYGVVLKGEDMKELKTVGDAIDMIASRAS